MRIGYCLTGSFCTFRKAIDTMSELVEKGYDVTPIMSENAYNTNTRFGKASYINAEIEDVCGKEIIRTITGAEPIGPKDMFDILVVAPCTGNTLAKLANGVTDTCVTMAVKSHLRNSKPVVIGVSTNDALGAAAKNIGALMNYKNYYLVPFGMDDCDKKPKSMVCDFSLIERTILLAAEGKRINRIIY
ncbi:MAG: dipicolinate synthase subunit B [Eubacterium sp.]|nr:dipicolinate synthase subunit B [Eubacterium sp.]